MRRDARRESTHASSALDDRSATSRRQGSRPSANSAAVRHEVRRRPRSSRRARTTPCRRSRPFAGARRHGRDDRPGPDSRRAAPADATPVTSAIARRILDVALHPQLQRLHPRSVSQQSSGAGTAPMAFCRNLIGSKIGGLAREHGALDQVGVSGKVLGDAVHDDVGAELKGCCRTGVAKVLSTTTNAPCACAIAAIAAMSDTISRGLVGVSSQTSRVRSVIAARPRRRAIRVSTWRDRQIDSRRIH